MVLTVKLSLVLMAAVFLLLYAAVGLIQDKRFFTSAPKDIRAAVTEHPERFRGARVLGWKLAVISLVTIVTVFLYGGRDGINNGFGFREHFLRFLTILYLWKAFDILGFDWFLLTKSRFFQHFYPETEGCESYSKFGFNRREQALRIVLYPFLAAAMAWLALQAGALIA